MEKYNDKIAQLFAEWQSLQPVAQEYSGRLDQKFMLEFNYNSNHLEGNTLTYGQTELLLLFGETKDSAPLKDYEEMKAHNVGLEMTKSAAVDRKRPLTEAFIRQLNQTILVQDYWKEAITPAGNPTRTKIKVGAYKSRPNSVITSTGEKFEYASPEETPALMTELVKWYNGAEKSGFLSPLQLAALLHYRYIRIHPFEDGNGRIARLLVNYVLHRAGYPMIVIRSDRHSKNEYLQILHQCDINSGLLPTDGAHASPEAIEPFTAYLAEQLIRALEISIKAAKGESIEEPGDFEKKISLLKKEVKKEEGKEDKRYNIDQFKNIFEHLYLPLTNKIRKDLKPVEEFFSNIQILSAIKTKSSKFHPLPEYKFETIDPSLQKYIIDIDNISYRYSLETPKGSYKLNPNLKIFVVIEISFADTYYKVNNFTPDIYSYGSYPTQEDINIYITKLQQDILLKIEKAKE